MTNGVHKRKIPHTEIERKRREKTQKCLEELKSLIPNCQGRQMHKLTILEHAVDYIKELKEQNEKRLVCPSPMRIDNLVS
jgi:hypothetical protein